MLRRQAACEALPGHVVGALDVAGEAAGVEQAQLQTPVVQVLLQPGQFVGVARQRPRERAEGWWASADITRGKVAFGQPMHLSADADVRMRDIAPLLSMFAQHKRFPHWIRRMIDAGGTTVTARTQMRDEQLIVDDIQASNDRFDVKARMRLDDAKPSGHLYARWGVFGMAMELTRGERAFHLAGAKKWFEAQQPYLQK